MAKRDLLKGRGGRIEPMNTPQSPFDAEGRIDQAIAESFPASDPPSWNSGIERPPRGKTPRKKPRTE